MASRQPNIPPQTGGRPQPGAATRPIVEANTPGRVPAVTPQSGAPRPNAGANTTSRPPVTTPQTSSTTGGTRPNAGANAPIRAPGPIPQAPASSNTLPASVSKPPGFSPHFWVTSCHPMNPKSYLQAISCTPNIISMTVNII